MAGPGGPSEDFESGVPSVAAPSNEAVATELLPPFSNIRRSTDGPSASSKLSIPSNAHVKREAPTDKPSGHPLLDKLVQKPWTKFYSYIKGPDSPRIWKIQPLFPRLQQLPLCLVDKFCPRQWQRISALAIFYIGWIVTFAAVLYKSSVADDIDGYGQPIRLSCGDAFWAENNGCGINGTLCLPFSDSSFAFRCPASCLSQQVLNIRTVGAQDVIYKPLVVGGPTPGDANEFSYRGDSFICSAAIHAGVITNSNGGCGLVSLTGQQRNYPAVSQNGIASIGFDSYFPSSFTFHSTSASCRDLRWDLLAVSVVYTTLLSLFTSSTSVFFYSIVIGCYLQAALATATPSASDISTLVSTAIGTLLPALFIAMVMYRLYIHRTLHGLTAQIEKTILWLGSCWVATLADYTFELIPLSRLTAHDVQQEPGALASLVVIVLVLFIVFVGQAWAFRREARLLRYLGLYLSLGAALGLLAAVPQQSLRIHHYILGLLLLPGTAVQTRPSLLYQGLLTGLFVNGLARWGFSPLLETAAALQGDALRGTATPAVAARAPTAARIAFAWPAVPEGFDGTSVLVNDVERFRGMNASGDGGRSFVWQRVVAGAPEYFRFGFFALSAAYGLEASDYTKAGTWFANGTWLQMSAGTT